MFRGFNSPWQSLRGNIRGNHTLVSSTVSFASLMQTGRNHAIVRIFLTSVPRVQHVVSGNRETGNQLLDKILVSLLTSYDQTFLGL